MKKLMLMMALTVTAAGLFAAPAKQSLVASAELAPFAEITPMATALGTAMNNPMLPAIALGGVQQVLMQNYGRLRSELPLRLQFYVATDELQKIDFTVKDPLKGKGDAALLYPIAENEDEFLKKHAGAEKAADGTIRLPPGGSRKEEIWAKFTADGKYCSFASTAALAARAADDFAKRPAAKAGKASHLLRFGVREAGLAAIVTVLRQIQERQQNELLKCGKKDQGPLADKFAAFTKARTQDQMALLNTFAGGVLALDLDDNGISIVGNLRRKPGVQTAEAGVALPAGALESMPMGPNLFFACNRLAKIAGDCANQEGFARQTALTHDLLQGLAEAVASEAQTNEDLQKYVELIKEVVLAADEALGAIAYPQKSDWDALAIGFDAQKRPAMLGGGQVATAAAEMTAGKKFLTRLAAALVRQWPGSQFLVQKNPDTFVVNWGSIIDFAAKETGATKDPKQMKDVSQVKKTLAGVLGGLSSEISFASNGQRAVFAAPGVKLAEGKGEARFLAAVPEAAKTRPGAAFYFTPYAFAREIVLPQAVKFGSKEMAQQIQAIQAALPPAAANGALAGASWYRPDGSIRFLLRLTGDEVKSIGGVVGALSAQGGDDDDDDNE